MAAKKILAVYDLQAKVRGQLKQIVASKSTIKEDELKKRLAVLDTRLCMAPCTLIMHDFQHYKSQGTQWFSEPFYTGPRGYKLCLCIFPNGYGDARGSYVTVSVYLMWGENDDILKWPATGRVRIEAQSYNTWIRNNETTTVSLCNFTTPVTSGERSEYGYGTYFFLERNYLHYYTNGNKLELKVTFSDY